MAWRHGVIKGPSEGEEKHFFSALKKRFDFVGAKPEAKESEPKNSKQMTKSPPVYFKTPLVVYKEKEQNVACTYCLAWTSPNQQPSVWTKCNDNSDLNNTYEGKEFNNFAPMDMTPYTDEESYYFNQNQMANMWFEPTGLDEEYSFKKRDIFSEPKKWTPEMDKFYNEVDPKLADITIENILEKLPDDAGWSVRKPHATPSRYFTQDFYGTSSNNLYWPEGVAQMNLTPYSDDEAFYNQTTYFIANENQVDNVWLEPSTGFWFNNTLYFYVF